MVARNKRTLRRLELGVETSIARDYNLGTQTQEQQLPTNSAEATKRETQAVEGELQSYSLNTLILKGLHPVKVFQGTIWNRLDHENLRTMMLQSCPGLDDTFSQFGNATGQSDTLKLIKLKKLYIRHETFGAKYRFSQVIERFLKSFSGLTVLNVLVDGTRDPQNLKPILAVHGKTLKTLVWDERRASVTSMDASTAVFHQQFSMLSTAANDCPFLTVLALPYPWKTMMELESYQTLVIYPHSRYEVMN